MTARKRCVYLIGAGPGDPGLISVKGKEILHACDVVIYDALVNEVLIALLPENVERIFAGKRGGKPSASQDEINRILVDQARKNRAVARLKGGDPLLLGRGSEEMEYLHQQKIEYEVVPGITSALAAPAWAGIPLTHRDLSRSVAIVTGHLKAGQPIEELKLPTADTLVFLMAMKNLDAITSRLQEQGNFTRDTPAAIVRNGTMPDQTVISGNLGNIAALKQMHAITPPAVLVVGETARFSESLSWYKSSPLAGTRVVTLRTPQQSRELIDILYARGATVIPCPVLKIVPREDALESIDRLYLDRFTMIIFTSPNGVRITMGAMLGKNVDTRAFFGKKIVAIGEATANELLRYGIIADMVPDKYIAEGILRILPQRLENENVLIPRASKARGVLPETLSRRGAQVTVLPVYDTVKSDLLRCQVKDGDYVLFTSSSTAEFFFSTPELQDTKIIPCCIGEITAETVRRYFNGRIIISENATVSALVAALERAVMETSAQTGADI